MSFPRYPEYKDSGVEWLGAVPTRWEVARLRFAATLNPSKSEVRHLDPSTLVSFLPMEAIGDDGTLELDRARPLHELTQGYTYFREGDVTLAKITPCYENGKGAVMTGLLNGVGFGTTELIVIRPKPAWTESAYLHYLFIASQFRALGESHMYGAGGQKRVPDSFVRDFITAWPLVEEQRLIAAFLDRETAKIDALVAEQRRLMELLKEKRQAVVSHAVTKGLNPDAPMKDSGVEWMGEVPAHWTIRRVRSVSTFRTSGPRGWAERVGTEGELFIQSGDLDDMLGLQFGKAKRVAITIDAESARTQLRNGDVLVCITGAKTGNVAVCEGLEEPAFVNQHICLVRPSEECIPRYLGEVLKSELGQRYFALSQYGLKQGLSLDDVGDALVPLPTTEEQARICEFLSVHARSNAALAGEASCVIDLLLERRAALISAAVTGQIDVRGLASEAAA